jgi:hypothetical protein
MFILTAGGLTRRLFFLLVSAVLHYADHFNASHFFARKYQKLVGRRWAHEAVKSRWLHCSKPMPVSSSGLGIGLGVKQFLAGDGIAGYRRLAFLGGEPIGQLMGLGPLDVGMLLGVELDHIVEIE